MSVSGCLRAVVPSIALLALAALLTAQQVASAGAPACTPAFIDNGLAGPTGGSNGVVVEEYKNALYLGQVSPDPIDGFALMRRVGNRWEPVGGGLHSSFVSSIVSTLTVHDLDGPDGGDMLFTDPPVLIVGGLFDINGSQSNIAAWNGQNFIDIDQSVIVPTGPNGGQVRSVATFDLDGDGPMLPSLIVAGDFTSIRGDSNLTGLIRLDDGVWSPLSAGLPTLSWPQFFVHRLKVLDPDGPGPEVEGLYALCGSSSMLPTNYIWRYSVAAASWVPVGPTAGNNETNEIVFDMTVYDPDNGTGIGERLIAAGTIFGSNRVASFNPMTNEWSPLPGAPAGIFANSNTYWVSLAVHDPPVVGASLPRTLYMGRGFEFNGAPISAPLYTFNGSAYTSWHPDGLDAVRHMNVFTDLFGDFDRQTLYLAGQSTAIPRFSMALRASGGEFLPAASTVNSPFALPSGNAVTAITSFDEDGPGSGTSTASLIVATEGLAAPLRGSTLHVPLSRWDGTRFSPFAPGAFRNTMCCDPVAIRAMTEFDPDDDGPVLPSFVVAGEFDEIDGQPAFGIASYSQVSGWQPLVVVGARPDVKCLVSMVPGVSAGLPAAIFAGGSFSSINGVEAFNCAYFDGGLWHPLGIGTNGAVHDAVVFDPDGPDGDDFDAALYVAGEFMNAGGLDARGIARWNGSFWESIPGEPDGQVFDLQLWDRDGPGGLPPILALAGDFSTVGFEVPARAVARFDFNGWQALGNAEVFEFGTRLAVLDPDGAGSAGEQLYVVLSNLAANRRLARHRPTGAFSSVWDTIAALGPPQYDGRTHLLTIDDDGYNRRPESLVLAGDLPSTFGAIRTDGLIRLTAPQRHLVDEIFATLNGAGAYLCGTIAGATDTVVFDYLEVTGNPSQEGFADLINTATFGAMHAINGIVGLDLFNHNLTLTQGGTVPSLVVGDETVHEALLYFYSSKSGSPIINVQDVVVAASPTPEFIHQSLVVDSATLRVNQDLQISPEGSGGSVWIYGSNSALQSHGNVLIAEAPGSEGELFVTDGALWFASGSSGELHVAMEGLANLDIGSDATAQTIFSTVYIASGPLGSGSIDIGEGGGGSWTQFGGSLFVGHQGYGLMRVRENSTFIGSDMHLIIGHVSGSTGEMLISDLPSEPGMTRVLANEISIGRFGGAGRIVLELGNPASRMQAFNITIGPDGVLEGYGSIEAAGTLENRGLLSPGVPAAEPGRGSGASGGVAIIQMQGDYRQLSAQQNEGVPGRLAISVEGPGLADRLDVAGLATLGGQLDVGFINNYLPAAGDFAGGVPVLVAFEILGRFDVANFPGLPPDPTGAPRFLRFETFQVPRGFAFVQLVEDTLATPPPNAATPQNYDVGGVGTDGALGDLNLDGLPDIAITIPDPVNPVNNPGSIVILFNGGSTDGFWHGFTSTSQITVAANPASLVIADFDGLNGNDIAYVSAADHSLYVLLNDGAGNFTGRGGIAPITLDGRPLHLIQRDFNQGGSPDVAIVTADDNTITALFNTADFGGVFTGFTGRETIIIPAGTASGTGTDVDNDKWDDIVVPNPGSNTTTVVTNTGNFFGRGGPVFNPVPVIVPVPGEPVDVDARDLNLDGFVDAAFVTRAGGTVTILLGNGTPNFLPPLTVPAGTDPSRLVLVDLDDDGDHDIAVITSNDSNDRVVRIIRNDLFGGDLSFVTQTDLLPGAVPELVLSDDLTGDGIFDLVTVNNSGGVLRAGTVERRDVTVFAFAACRGDANNDRIVDMQDVAATLTNFGMNYRPGTGPGDADGNGIVEFADITASLTSWGQVCP